MYKKAYTKRPKYCISLFLELMLNISPMQLLLQTGSVTVFGPKHKSLQLTRHTT